jgi:hypothetical protein
MVETTLDLRPLVSSSALVVEVVSAQVSMPLLGLLPGFSSPSQKKLVAKAGDSVSSC